MASVLAGYTNPALAGRAVPGAMGPAWHPNRDPCPQSVLIYHRTRSPMLRSKKRWITSGRPLICFIRIRIEVCRPPVKTHPVSVATSSVCRACGLLISKE